jgi:hypothetical protein
LKRIYPKLGVRSRVELVARMIGTDGMLIGHHDHHHPHPHPREPEPGTEVMN